MEGEENQEQNQAQPQPESESSSSGNKNMIIAGVVVLIIVIVGLGYYFLVGREAMGGAEEMVESTPPTTSQNESMQTSTDSSSMQDVQEVTVDGSEYKYSPNTINVTQGKPVRLTFNNTGTKPHNLTIDGLNVTTKTIQGGESDTVEFTPTQTGTFTFYCSVDGHRGLGMEGKMTVE